MNEKTQLIISCPNCNTPLIVENGVRKIICHVCNREIEVSKVRTESFVFNATLLDKLDLIDLSILKRFYMCGREPFDTMPHCLPMLHKELKKVGIKLCRRGLEYRLKKLVKLGLIRKIERTNPSIYEPIYEIRKFVRKIILLALARVGLNKI